MITPDPEGALSVLSDAILAINGDDLTVGAIPDLARRLERLDEISTRLKEMTDALRADIAERMEDDEMTLTGIGTLRRRPVYSSTWRDDEAKSRMWDDAVAAIVRRVAVDPATGEIHRHLANIVSETWRLVTDAFSIGADPKTPFRKTLGLDPGDYRSRRRLGQTVSLADRDDR